MKSLAFLLLFCAFGTAWGQVEEPALSNAEVEILRDRAADPPERVLAFLGFLEDRTKAVDKLVTLRRRPGKDQDLHDMIEQFTSIANDLEDNLEEYDKRHKDVRKVLPKLLAATERWATALKSPAENEQYNVARKLALEAVADVKETAVAMVADQKAWFLAHPPAKIDGNKLPSEQSGFPRQGMLSWVGCECSSTRSA